jgi:anthranilate phosphoribosyltransferase
VPRPELTELLARSLMMLGSDARWVVHGADGIDEISTTGLHEGVGVPRRCGQHLLRASVRLSACPKGDPRCADRGRCRENAAIIREVLAGDAAPRRDVVLLNAGVRCSFGGRVDTIKDGIAVAAAADRFRRSAAAARADGRQLARGGGGMTSALTCF